MYGGLTGFGGGSLGGLLLGGVRKADMTAAQLRSYNDRLAKSRASRQHFREYSMARILAPNEDGSPHTSRQVSGHIRRAIQSLIKAEQSASGSPWGTAHPEFADDLRYDAGYNTALLARGGTPAWAKHKYAGIARPPPDIERMMAGKAAKALQREQTGERRYFNTRTGRYAYANAKNAAYLDRERPEP